ncbi:MAG: beta-lactamase family protein [Clostridia bacterium]|nr:beta-lactamase family protein [Clostridia bacterium]
MKRLDVEKMSALIREHAEAELRDQRIRGKEIVIRRDGETVYHETFGASCADGKPLEKNRIYRLASMTKPVTATAVMQLADRGLLDVDGPASEYFPQMKELKVATVKDGKIVKLVPAENEIMICDLLCHTSGIGCSPVLELTRSTAKLPLDEALEQILRQPLSFEPRTSQMYSPTDAFDVAAGIVELVSGMPFDEYLKKNIFDPLEMPDTTFAPTADQRRRTVALFDRTPEGVGFDAPTPDDAVFADYAPQRMPAGAGLVSAARDYMRFAQMLCNCGKAFNGARILSPEAVKRMSSSNIPDNIDMGCERWGLGVRVIVSSGYPHGLGVGCFGWSGAYGTHFWNDPENRLTVVMMKNSLYDGGAGNNSATSLERDVSACLI